EKPVGLLGLVLILAALCVQEFYGLAKAKGFIPQVGVGIIFTLLLVLGFAHHRVNYLINQDLITRFTTFPLVETVLIGLFITVLTHEMFRGMPNPYNHISMTIAGVIYVGVGLGCFYGVREYFLARSINPVSPEIIQPGPFVITVLAAIWICDTAAYAFGRMLGKNKLFERVSPNKTWEGAIGGLIFSLVTFFAARAFVPGLAGLSVVDCVVLGHIVGIFGQIGDLAESQLKRDVGVKDSSNLIPGHGGVLDRLDSILFVFPLVYLYLYLAAV
ncbi:MAG TPA: phosphatidate cytidylyltransferase, partial [Candidatus Kapabacteria bacterium]|nr:phosphatidate cytidylyltransferase [Candidatus Kapabacteria bacterium]